MAAVASYDVLSQIFLTALRDDIEDYDNNREVDLNANFVWKFVDTPLTITAVCRHWRHQALDMPLLWSFVQILISRYEQGGNNRDGQLERAKHFISHSKDAPLRLAIEQLDQSLPRNVVDDWMTSTIPVLRLIRQERVQDLSLRLPAFSRAPIRFEGLLFPNCTTFRTKRTGSSFRDIPPFVPIHPKNLHLPKLRALYNGSLSVDISGDYIKNHLFNNGRELQELHMSGRGSIMRLADTFPVGSPQYLRVLSWSHGTFSPFTTRAYIPKHYEELKARYGHDTDFPLLEELRVTACSAEIFIHLQTLGLHKVSHVVLRDIRHVDSSVVFNFLSYVANTLKTLEWHAPPPFAGAAWVEELRRLHFIEQVSVFKPDDAMSGLVELALSEGQVLDLLPHLREFRVHYDGVFHSLIHRKAT